MFSSLYDKNNLYYESSMNLENSLNEEVPFFKNELDVTNNSFILGNSESFLDKKEFNSDYFVSNLKQLDDEDNNYSYFLKNNLLNNIKIPNEEKGNKIIKKDEYLNQTGNNKSTEEKSLTKELIIKDSSKNEKKHKN